MLNLLLENNNVHNNILFILKGVLYSAYWLSNNMDEPTLVKGLIEAEIIEHGLADLAGCKKLAKEEGIDLDKLWKSERFK
jgi:hypothetical protein